MGRGRCTEQSTRNSGKKPAHSIGKSGSICEIHSELKENIKKHVGVLLGSRRRSASVGFAHTPQSNDFQDLILRYRTDKGVANLGSLFVPFQSKN